MKVKGDLEEIAEGPVVTSFAVIKSSETINDVDVHYLKLGSGRLNLLIIPGVLGCAQRDFPVSFLKRFDLNKYTLVVIDPPGYGKSRPPDRVQHLERCKDDARIALQLMRRLELGSYSVLGFCEGGRTAIWCAYLGKRTAVTKVALWSFNGRIDTRGTRYWNSMLDPNDWPKQRREAFLQCYDEKYLEEQWRSYVELVTTVSDDYKGKFPCWRILRKLRQPVLLLHGERDSYCLAPQQALQEIDDVRMFSHGEAAHDIHLEQPQWFIEKMQDFLALDI